MTFSESIKTCFSKYVTFSGRASRSEFWYWSLFVFIVSLVLTLIDIFVLNQPNLSPLANLFTLGVILPGIAVNIRRLHDLDKSGWWLLIVLIPIIGVIILLVWECTKGTQGANNFGHDPLGGGGAEVFE